MPMKQVEADADVSADLSDLEPDPLYAVSLFRCLADPTRLRILRHLSLGEHRVVDLTAHLSLAQSTVSQHLASMRECGLVSSRAAGRASMYSLATVPELMDLLGAAERLLAVTGHPAEVDVIHSAAPLPAEKG